ncbi:hypothetical protein RCL1_007590 [Eukaryota sp. TZLM3-RCL]
MSQLTVSNAGYPVVSQTQQQPYQQPITQAPSNSTPGFFTIMNGQRVFVQGPQPNMNQTAPMNPGMPPQPNETVIQTQTQFSIPQEEKSSCSVCLVVLLVCVGLFTVIGVVIVASGGGSFGDDDNEPIDGLTRVFEATVTNWIDGDWIGQYVYANVDSKVVTLTGVYVAPDARIWTARVSCSNNIIRYARRLTLWGTTSRSCFTSNQNCDEVVDYVVVRKNAVRTSDTEFIGGVQTIVYTRGSEKWFYDEQLGVVRRYCNQQGCVHFSNHFSLSSSSNWLSPPTDCVNRDGIFL